MAYLGTPPKSRVLSSADIATGAVTLDDISFTDQSTSVNVSGNIDKHTMRLSDEVVIDGDLNITDNLILSKISDDGNAITLTTDGSTRTIEGAGGSLEASTLTQTPNASLTGMTGEIGSAVTGSPNLNLSNSTGSIGSAVTGFTGIKEFDQWRITSGFAGDANPITSNYERNDGHGSSGGFSKLGTGMTESSGIFTFPSTGYWYIHFGHNHYSTGANRYCYGNILLTTNNASSWDTFGLAKFHISDIGEYAHTSAHHMAFFDVTDTSTHKVAFRIHKDSGGTAVTTNGETGDNSTYMTFIRIGDT